MIWFHGQSEGQSRTVGGPDVAPGLYFAHVWRKKSGLLVIQCCHQMNTFVLLSLIYWKKNMWSKSNAIPMYFLATHCIFSGSFFFPLSNMSLSLLRPLYVTWRINDKDSSYQKPYLGKWSYLWQNQKHNFSVFSDIGKQPLIRQWHCKTTVALPQKIKLFSL